MNDPFKSENYKKNLDSLIEAIKLKNIGEQYNKTVRDLSQTLESFTDKAEDVAKFVICSDLNNYIEPVNKKPSGFLGIFKETFNKILGKNASIQDNDIRNFANDKLPSLAEKITFEYLNVLKKISDLEQSKKNQEEHRLYGVNLEDRTASKQEENPVLPKPPRAPQVPKKMFTTGQEVRQESKVVVKDKPAVPPKPKNLSRADQKVSTELKVVEVILKKSAESKPTVPLKSENQDNRKSAQKAAGKAIPKVAAATMKGGANREMGSKVKALKEKFEQNQAKGNANVRLAESKTTPAAQADIGAKKKQSHSFLTENKRSATKHITAKSDPKFHVSKNPPSTQVSVKEMVAQIEKGKGGR